jgi:hypothetical protein
VGKNCFHHLQDMLCFLCPEDGVSILNNNIVTSKITQRHVQEDHSSYKIIFDQARDFDDPPGLMEKTEYLLREWITIHYSATAGRDPTRAFSIFVQQVWPIAVSIRTHHCAELPLCIRLIPFCSRCPVVSVQANWTCRVWNFCFNEPFSASIIAVITFFSLQVPQVTDISLFSVLTKHLNIFYINICPFPLYVLSNTIICEWIFVLVFESLVTCLFI